MNSEKITAYELFHKISKGNNIIIFAFVNLLYVLHIYSVVFRFNCRLHVIDILSHWFNKLMQYCLMTDSLQTILLVD